MNELLIHELEKEAAQLELWAEESRHGGWSTHQVEPMKRRAQEIWVILGRIKAGKIQ